jgi:hypothetical protein
MKRSLLVAGVAAIMVLGGTVAVAQSATTDVACTITDNTLSCPLPAPVVTTVTQQATVTAPAVTVTQTAPPVTVTVSPSASPTPSPSPTLSPSPSPSPTPTPSSTGTPPPSSDWPGADNTGVPAGVTLAPSGGLTVTQAGTVIDGKDITGNVVIKAANVVNQNSRIKGSGAYCVQTLSGSVTIEDTEIIGGCENAIGFDNWTARRVEVKGTYGDGVKLGNNVLLQDSWIHDLAPASGAHADGGQVQGGVTNTVIRHNVIDLGSTPRANAALFMAPDQGPSTNGPLIVEGNKLNGGNYILFCVDGNNGQYHIKNITISGNRFGNTFTYGRSRVNEPVTQSGNVVDSTGAAMTL